MVVALVAPTLPPDCAFASPQYKGIAAKLGKYQQQPKPVSDPFFPVTLPYDEHMAHRQAKWVDTVPWEMANVHAFMLDMFERMYAVSIHRSRHSLDNGG